MLFALPDVCVQVIERFHVHRLEAGDLRETLDFLPGQSNVVAKADHGRQVSIGHYTTTIFALFYSLVSTSSRYFSNKCSPVSTVAPQSDCTVTSPLPAVPPSRSLRQSCNILDFRSGGLVAKPAPCRWIDLDRTTALGTKIDQHTVLPNPSVGKQFVQQLRRKADRHIVDEQTLRCQATCAPSRMACCHRPPTRPTVPGKAPSPGQARRLTGLTLTPVPGHFSQHHLRRRLGIAKIEPIAAMAVALEQACMDRPPRRARIDATHDQISTRTVQTVAFKILVPIRLGNPVQPIELIEPVDGHHRFETAHISRTVKLATHVRLAHAVPIERGDV